MLFRWFANIPIFRRLFLTFFLAVLVPDFIILLMSIFSIHELTTLGIKTNETAPFTIGTMLALIASTAVVIVLGYLLNRTITQPLSQLASLAKRIRQGETSARAPITGRDEIAIVASSINTMLDQIVQFIQETQGQRDYLQGRVEHLIHEVSGVGEGNLSIQAEVTSDSLGVLADSFNYMVEALSSLVIRVKRVAFEVENSTTSTQQEMLRLVTTADTQLQQIDRTARTIDAMAQACLQVVERTHILDHAAKEARQTAQQGRQTVQQTLQGIENIHATAQQTASQIQMLGERSQEIDEIVHVLENIAHQTNRLALDAAIQVALNGNAENSGFGAVADGMRHLAEQTKEQLNTVARNVKRVRTEIVTVAESIQESERETAEEATRIRETGTSLSTIFSIIEQQAAEIGTINRMTEHLLHSAREISQTMNTLSNITTQSSDSTRAVAQKMRQTTLLAQQLRRSVEVFKIKDATLPPSQPQQPMSVK
jgi:methyl-accepting chemotaxis protein